jgi:hypothetical protein
MKMIFTNKKICFLIKKQKLLRTRFILGKKEVRNALTPNTKQNNK